MEKSWHQLGKSWHELGAAPYGPKALGPAIMAGLQIAEPST